MNVKSVLLLFPLAILMTSGWQHSLNDAKHIAKTERKQILLNFSGSDWCGPCMRLRADFFDQPEFERMADSTLVLLNADFPRKKKNQLSAAQQAENDALADKYNPEGKFPMTLLLDSDGKVLKIWDGYPEGKSTDKFIAEILAAISASH